ncbi:MAG: PD-(D/E)XK nuclease-like domain-containing protein [Pseudonocardia sp.]|nr:PD-(D/E)XK nuclease-like domain-containing protein [Pseudonocardia sp.]
MTATVPAAIEITDPGIYDMPAHQYHADPVPGGSLSSSGARKLLPPSCPAKFRHWLDHGQGHKPEFDLGHAAHAEVLGAGEPITVIEAAGYTTKAAREARDAAYAAGETPLLAREHRQVLAMARAVRQHPIAGPLLDPGRGHAERALFWQDPEFDVWRRAMVDKYLYLDDGRLLLVDYKTTKSAEPGSVARSIVDYGYHQQDPWYLDGAIATGLAGDQPPGFVFVFQEKTAPYLITVFEVHPEDRDWGRLDNRRALRTYRDCTRTGHWPGYADDVIPVRLPAWAAHQKEAAYARGDYHEQDTTT